MSQYVEKGQELLKVLSKNGCDAYIIGEASRCEIMKIDPQEVEIVSSATPTVLSNLFTDAKVEVVDDYTAKVIYDPYVFIHHTFRSSNTSHSKKKSATPLYSKNLAEELERRDFTINAIALSSGGKFFDAYNGFKHIHKKVLIGIGNSKLKFKNNPIYTLKMVSLFSELGFKIHSSLQTPAKMGMKFISSVSVDDTIHELSRILVGKHAKQAIKTLHVLGAAKQLPVFGKEISRLAKANKTESLDQLLINSVVLQGEVLEDYINYTSNPEFFKKVANLAIATPKSNYDNVLLFNYGLDIAIAANDVNHAIGKAKKHTKQITKQYQRLTIKKPCDLVFKANNLMELANNQEGTFVTDIMEEVIYKVVTSELPNDYEVIQTYVARRLQQLDVLPTLDQTPTFVVPEEETPRRPDVVFPREEVTPRKPEVIVPREEVSPKPEVFQVINNIPAPQQVVNNPAQVVSQEYNEYRFSALQREISEVKRIIAEKDRQIASMKKEQLIIKLNKEASEQVNQNLSSISFENEYERDMYARQMKKLYREMLLKKPEYSELTKEDLENEKN